MKYSIVPINFKIYNKCHVYFLISPYHIFVHKTLHELCSIKMTTTADECAAERSYREAYGRRYSQGVSTAPTGTKQVVGGPSSTIGYMQPVVTPIANVDIQGASGASGGGVSHFTKMKMSQSGILNTLRTIREPIVDYQENRGVSRDEQISFVTLITSLCTQAYTAAITILVMLWNLAPLLDGFVYFARFVLDKLIDIIQTEDQKEKVIKAAVFFGEIIVILLIIFLIMGLIFMPVYVLAARIVSKIWGMIAW